jgi:excisionase family DNA binding protein
VPIELDDALEILTADEVAGLLGLDRKTVYDAARRGQIPHRRVGRRLLFERQTIVDWLRNPSVTLKPKR